MTLGGEGPKFGASPKRVRPDLRSEVVREVRSPYRRGPVGLRTSETFRNKPNPPPDWCWEPLPNTNQET